MIERRRPNVPRPSSTAAGVRLKSQRTEDTEPERLLRSKLHRSGLRFRVHWPIPGTRRRADLAFVAARVAVLVDGCFWHGCPDHGTWPKANAAWWRKKIEANRARDLSTTEFLTSAGWSVVRLWEHDVKANIGACVDRIAMAVRRRRR